MKKLLALLIFAILSVNANAKGMQGNSPFLVKLPHLTKVVKQNWDNQEFGLTKKQKEKLLVIRKETIKGVKTLKPQIVELSKKIRQSTLKGGDIKKIDKMVEKLAKLKAKLTKVQVRCVVKTKKILTKKQLKFLHNKKNKV